MASTSLPGIPLSTQVGGHAGVMTSEDGSLLIKPALPLELHFYQTSVQDPEFAPLRPFIPKFYGTLKLEGKVNESKGVGNDQGLAVTPLEETHTSKDKHSLVLENLSHPFCKPNIIDIKLGTVLYDESASPEKVARMIKTAEETTSLETGIRLTGFQVYDNITGAAVNTPKSYGKSIKPSDLAEGIARFFPVGTPPSSSSDAAADPMSLPSSSSGLPHSTLLPTLRSIREDVAELREAIAQVHIRMVGGSALIVYEADWVRAEEGLRVLMEGDDESDENEDEEDDDEERKPGPLHVVKLIDFAHTRIVPGQGPDEGVLLGLDTVIKLLDGRIEQVSRMVC